MAVIADRYWRAKEALALLDPQWDTGEAGKSDSAQFKKMYRDALDGPLVEVASLTYRLLFVLLEVPRFERRFERGVGQRTVLAVRLKPTGKLERSHGVRGIDAVIAVDSVAVIANLEQQSLEFPDILALHQRGGALEKPFSKARYRRLLILPR